MDEMKKSNNSNGFTLIELIAVMVIITVILGAVLAVAQGATDTSRITSTVSSIRALQTASINYYNANGGTYTNGSIGTISLVNLAAQNMLPGNFNITGSSAGTDAWGGAITVTPDANNASYFDIQLTNVPSSANQALASAISNIVQTTPTNTDGTWIAAF